MNKLSILFIGIFILLIIGCSEDETIVFDDEIQDMEWLDEDDEEINISDAIYEIDDDRLGEEGMDIGGPEFPGGQEAMSRFISDNIVYPMEAIKKGISGKVFVQFIVEGDGSISDIQIAKSADPLLDQAAIDVIKKMPNWIPAEKEGVEVSEKFTLPINFNL